MSNHQKRGEIHRNIIFTVLHDCECCLNSSFQFNQLTEHSKCAEYYAKEVYSNLFIFGTTICSSFLDNDVENDLQSDISWALQDTDRKAERMQLLLDSCSLGFPEPDLGSLGLSAAKKNPSSKVLPGSKCCV
jgi:hypothetical protein